MNGEVYDVVPGRAIAASQHGVIHQIRKGSEGPVQSGGRGSVPILLGPDEMNVLRRRAMHASVFQNDGLVIEWKAGGEGIRISGERQAPQRKHGHNMLAPGW